MNARARQDRVIERVGALAGQRSGETANPRRLQQLLQPIASV